MIFLWSPLFFRCCKFLRIRSHGRKILQPITDMTWSTESQKLHQICTSKLWRYYGNNIKVLRSMPVPYRSLPGEIGRLCSSNSNIIVSQSQAPFPTHPFHEQQPLKAIREQSTAILWNVFSPLKSNTTPEHWSSWQERTIFQTSNDIKSGSILLMDRIRFISLAWNNLCWNCLRCDMWYICYCTTYVNCFAWYCLLIKSSAKLLSFRLTSHSHDQALIDFHLNANTYTRQTAKYRSFPETT